MTSHLWKMKIAFKNIISKKYILGTICFSFQYLFFVYYVIKTHFHLCFILVNTIEFHKVFTLSNSFGFPFFYYLQVSEVIYI